MDKNQLRSSAVGFSGVLFCYAGQQELLRNTSLASNRLHITNKKILDVQTLQAARNFCNNSYFEDLVMSFVTVRPEYLASIIMSVVYLSTHNQKVSCSLN